MKKKDAVRYAQMLLARCEHQERCAKHLGEALLVGLALDKTELGTQERQLFEDAGYLAYRILSSQGGMDLMFSEEGEFSGVVL